MQTIENVNNLMIDTLFADTATANSINHNIHTRNTQEDNQKAVNEIYINQVAYEQDTTIAGCRFYNYSYEDSTALYDVAYQNPIYGGDAVLQARVMLCIDITDDADFDNRSMIMPKSDLYFKVFPNPNNGTMTVIYKVEENAKVVFQLFDVAGRKVKEQTLNSQEQQTTINANELKSGNYYYKITTDDGIKRIGKLIIIK